MTTNADPAILSILQAQEMKGERLVNHIRLGFALLGLFGLFGAWPVNTEAANLVFALQGIGWVIYAGLVYLVLRLVGDRYLGWLKYVTISLDLSLLSLSSLAVSVNHSGILEYFLSALPLMFIFCTLLSGFRFSLAAALYATVLTTLLNGGILLWAVANHLVAVSPTSVYGAPAINIADQLLIIASISAPGVLAGIIARTGRRLVLRAAVESRRRVRLEGERDRLGKYLSRDLVEMVLQNPGQMELGGSRRVATIMFTDIRNFTPFSEKREPEEVVRFLNRYFTAMAEVVFRYRGTLDKYLGDGLLAEFGIPFAIARSPLRAVVGALEMMHALRTLNEQMGDCGPTTWRSGWASPPARWWPATSARPSAWSTPASATR